MMMQLHPTIPVTTPKGHGQAHFLIDYSIEQDLYWVVFLDNSGECWTFNNRDIRAQKNTTIGRNQLSSQDATLTPATPLHFRPQLHQS